VVCGARRSGNEAGESLDRRRNIVTELMTLMTATGSRADDRVTSSRLDLWRDRSPHQPRRPAAAKVIDVLEIERGTGGRSATCCRAMCRFPRRSPGTADGRSNHDGCSPSLLEDDPLAEIWNQQANLG
jgi:hypothetical protein